MEIWWCGSILFFLISILSELSEMGLCLFVKCSGFGFVKLFTPPLLKFKGCPDAVLLVDDCLLLFVNVYLSVLLFKLIKIFIKSFALLIIVNFVVVRVLTLVFVCIFVIFPVCNGRVLAKFVSYEPAIIRFVKVGHRDDISDKNDNESGS